ncbi:polysaccharide biosynthesis tyrosine autokinase [Burkholderia cepacia]|uniref:polysaccharide biosynthesis tyrosine autokinase n=1 Tax=Burkholderia cepacia TaxID=292 RepID=UPI001CF564E0|nr:polysaccharide biosynthesis tyrosine autokinase [Burkholderia cepacia]MCA7977734.1 polysaccharide biosynthesis tyrosine autokinase [Burkholderia cepacia]
MNISPRAPRFASDSDEIDVRGIADALTRNTRLIVAIAAAGTLLGATYAFVATPIYRADATIQIESAGADMMGHAALGLVGGLGTLFDANSTADGEMEILRTRLVTAPVVDDQRLYIDAQPRRIPLVGHALARFADGLSTPGLFGIGGFVRGNEHIDVATFDVPQASFGKRFIVTALEGGRYRLTGDGIDRDAIGRIGAELRVATDAGPVTLLVTAIDGRPGAQFTVRRLSKQDTLDALQKHLSIAEKGKSQSGVIGLSYESDDPAKSAAVLNGIARNYTQQNASRKAAAAEKSLEFANAQLPAVERQLRTVEDRLNAYQTKHELVDMSEQAKAMLDRATTAQTGLFNLEQKRQALAAVYTPEHPELAALDRQIAAARALVGSIDRAIRRLPADQQNVLRLRRDVTVQTEIYVGLLNSIQQLRLATASKIGNARVIDYAIVPEQPVRPKRALIVALAAFAGLVAGIGVACARASLFGGVSDPDDIERDGEFNVVATIPLSEARRRIRKDGAPALPARARPHDPAMEAMRSLGTALQFMQLDRPDNRIVLIGGASPDIGKSFVSANLAVLLGQSYKRVLLIDGDLRRGRLAQSFNVGARIGLSTVLRGESAATAAIVSEVSPNLDLLPTGPRVAEPNALLSSDRLPRLLAEVAPRYDVVLIDSAPLLPVSDATLLAPHAGTVLLVARAGVTQYGEIVESARRIERVGATLAGIVLNGFRPGLRAMRYGNYGAYAYDSTDPSDRASH